MPAENNAQPTTREDWLDLLKTLLIYGMVSTHVVQLIGFGPPRWLVGYTEFINLVTFSGFLLAFGLGVGMPKPARQRSWWQRLRPALLLLGATWASSLGFVLLVERQALTPGLLADLLSLRVLYGWSEFLASFFTLYLLIALARPLLLRLAASPWLLAAAIALCLASTRLTTSVDLPLLATLVGTTNYASFPLLPYLPWFLVGIYLGQRQRGPTPLEWILAAAASAGFGWFLLQFGELPQRFPPSALWIVGPALPLALYLVLSRLAAARLRLPPLLLAPGRHVLAALLVSNLAIFAIRHLYGRPLRAWWWMLAAGAALLVLVTLWGWALELRRRRGTA